MASEKTCLWHNSGTGKPDSASHRKPMIRSSVNRYLTSNLRSLGIGLQSHSLLKSGGTSEVQGQAKCRSMGLGLQPVS